MNENEKTQLPVAVIGAGPIGLVAALHLLERGIEPLVLEAGPGPGSSIREWGHIHVFSPWKYMVDPLARRVLEGRGWRMPANGEALPSGAEFVNGFLEPLADVLAGRVRYGQRVVAVTRQGLDKVRSAGREGQPFELLALDADGTERRYRARAVIDASGTFEQPNPLGSNGLPVPGESRWRARGTGNGAAHPRVRYGLPPVLGAERARYANRRTLVVGSGHSAFNVLLDLVRLRTEEPGTEIEWAIRRPDPGLMFGGGAKDALPARGSLGSKLRELVELGLIQLETGFRATELVDTGDRVTVRGEDRDLGPYDEVVVATGFRPDLDMLRELRLDLDPALECPERLGPLIDPNVHSCGTVYPHGYEELRHPERDFFIAGMKSYGRAPTFLLLTGYEQVRSITAALAGDMEGARQVQLELPETGVCSTDLAGSGCCSTVDVAVAAAGSRLPVLETVGAGGGCGCG